jgi:hypothetical protein
MSYTCLNRSEKRLDVDRDELDIIQSLWCLPCSFNISTIFQIYNIRQRWRPRSGSVSQWWMKPALQHHVVSVQPYIPIGNLSRCQLYQHHLIMELALNKAPQDIWGFPGQTTDGRSRHELFHAALDLYSQNHPLFRWFDQPWRDSCNQCRADESLERMQTCIALPAILGINWQDYLVSRHIHNLFYRSYRNLQLKGTIILVLDNLTKLSIVGHDQIRNRL